jgi:hypothetical protein
MFRCKVILGGNLNACKFDKLLDEDDVFAELEADVQQIEQQNDKYR